MVGPLPEDFIKKAFALDGRVAAVTGGASGLGAAISAGLAQAGAAIAVVDLDTERAGALAETLRESGGPATSHKCDVTDSGQLERLAHEIEQELGPVDILINSAGTAFRSPAEDFPEDEFDRVIALNLKATFLSCQTFGRKMLTRKGGNIINIASIGGFVAYPHAAPYLSSKGGVVQLTRGLALEWIGKVRVNAIAPTLFDTPLTDRGARTSSTTSQFIEERFLREGLPQPHHVAGAAVFLASEAAALVTGHTLPVDDGYLIA